MLTGKAPDLRGIVVFGSSCSVYGDPHKNLLRQRLQRGVIVSISAETKGYKVLLRKENKVIVTQHVRNIETLSDAQNAKLQRAMDAGDRVDDTEAAAEAVAATRDGNREAPKDRSA